MGSNSSVPPITSAFLGRFLHLPGPRFPLVCNGVTVSTAACPSGDEKVPAHGLTRGASPVSGNGLIISFSVEKGTSLSAAPYPHRMGLLRPVIVRAVPVVLSKTDAGPALTWSQGPTRSWSAGLLRTVRGAPEFRDPHLCSRPTSVSSLGELWERVFQ